MKEVIKVNNLTKIYGKQTVVKAISFCVHQGEVFGVLGENGAGKTTTLEIIEGLRTATSGDVEVLGKKQNGNLDIKQLIGIQLQSSAYFAHLTLLEILNLFASFYHKSKDPVELLRIVDLEEKAGSLVSSLSGGQKQRFSIAASLINDPAIVFLDEPTTGLDPLARRSIWELVENIKKQGKTIILTTHYMEEAEKLCDRIAIMDSGNILLLDKTENLLEKPKFAHFVKFTTHKDVADIVKIFSTLAEVEINKLEINLKISNKEKLKQALKVVMAYEPETLEVRHATLEDLFIELTGKTLANQ